MLHLCLSHKVANRSISWAKHLKGLRTTYVRPGMILQLGICLLVPDELVIFSWWILCFFATGPTKISLFWKNPSQMEIKSANFYNKNGISTLLPRITLSEFQNSVFFQVELPFNHGLFDLKSEFRQSWEEFTVINACHFFPKLPWFGWISWKLNQLPSKWRPTSQSRSHPNRQSLKLPKKNKSSEC